MEKHLKVIPLLDKQLFRLKEEAKSKGIVSDPSLAVRIRKIGSKQNKEGKIIYSIYILKRFFLKGMHSQDFCYMLMALGIMELVFFLKCNMYKI